MLSGYRVIETTDERGFLAGRILADLGAEVIKVEPPDGDVERRLGPFVDGKEDIERSIPWLAANVGKHSVTADLDNSDGRHRLLKLLGSADLLLDSHSPSFLESRGLGWKTLHDQFPRLVYCSITPFGRTGPYAEMTAHDLVAVAMGGNAWMTGDPDDAPLRCSSPTSYFHAGPEAVLGSLMALESRESTGAGTLVDVSIQECQLATLMTGAGQWGRGKTAPRRAGSRVSRTREIWAAADGWISFGLRGGQARTKNLVATVSYMKEENACPQWLADYDWSAFDHTKLEDDELTRFEKAFASFFQTKSRRELYETALERRIMLAPCNDAREILQHPQLASRDLFATVEYPHLGVSLEQPAFFARTASGKNEIRWRAPILGEHDSAAFATTLAPPAPQKERTNKSPIYDDLEILEFGSGAAGPVSTRYFADQGANVIRIESTKRPDFLRLLFRSDKDPSGLNASPMFTLINANKQSLTIDMTNEQGRTLVMDLIKRADVVADNFSPGVMDKWGFGATELRRQRPELIVVSGCLFGQTGPHCHYPGFGGQGAAIAGFNHMTGYQQAEALGPYGTITDSLSPRFVATLVAAALLRRRHSGEGETIDLSQIETGVYCLSEMIARYSATGEVPERRGNHCEYAAPHSIYPCRGEDRWLAIAVLSNKQWYALVELMGSPDWARADQLSEITGRLAAQEILDEKIAKWTSAQEPYELMERLQAAGVEAGVVQNFRDLAVDPQLEHRSHFADFEHEFLGTIHAEHPGFRIEGQPGRISSLGPKIGEHNERILTGTLSKSTAELTTLEADGALV